MDDFLSVMGRIAETAVSMGLAKGIYYFILLLIAAYLGWTALRAFRRYLARLKQQVVQSAVELPKKAAKSAARAVGRAGSAAIGKAIDAGRVTAQAVTSTAAPVARQASDKLIDGVAMAKDLAASAAPIAADAAAKAIPVATKAVGVTAGFLAGQAAAVAENLKTGFINGGKAGLNQQTKATDNLPATADRKNNSPT